MYEGVVAFEGFDTHAELYFHDGESFSCLEVPFTPFCVTSEVPQGIEDFTELSGSHPLRYRLPGLEAPAKIPAFQFRDLRSCGMVSAGVRLFGNMSFAQLRRMQIQVSGSEKSLEKIRCLTPSGQSVELAGTESGILKDFIALVKKEDPDVLEGYDCFRNDWIFLAKCAARNKLPLLLGRRDREITKSRSSIVIGEHRINYPRTDCPGRHLVDMFFSVQLHDVIKREMAGYSISDAAAYFGFENTDELHCIRALGTLLTQSAFYCTQLIPWSFQDILVRGNGSKIDLLFAGEYLSRGHSLPMPDPPVFFPGATSKAERFGIFRPVQHCDIRSLYPSILVADNLYPVKDELQIFPAMLSDLRKRRLDAKDRAKHGAPEEKNHWSALQEALKIIINSFYGYLGFPQGAFNDYALAAKVTARGREILAQLTGFLEKSGAEVIEMDTDGVYFRPPHERSRSEYAAEVQKVLPPGIEIEFDAFYEAMYSYKAKNYALLTQEGDIELTGAALKSRGMEKFFRDVLKEIFRLQLAGENEALQSLYRSSMEKITFHTVPLEELCKSETLSDSTANYSKKLSSGSGRRSAPYELLLKSGLAGKAGDRVEYYITGEKVKVVIFENSKLIQNNSGERDENINYYIARLQELFKNFAPVFQK